MFRWILRLYTLIVFQILCPTCTKSSLTFVIDDTGSMEGDINEVKRAAEDILNIVMTEKGGEIEDVLLVTFNDNSFYIKSVMLRTKTSDKSEFLEALNDIVVYGGDDCPENALEGIKLGLEESSDGSYLFVFTDASAKDFMKLNEIKQLCEEKQSQVIFIITGFCGSIFTPGHRVFYDIAKACSGQVFFVEKYEVKHVVKIIKETVKDKKSVLTWVTVPANYAHWRRVPFTVDDKTEYVIVSTSGRNVNLQVRDGASYRGRQMATGILLWSKSAKVVKFYAPSPGIYYVLVKGETDVSIVVYARTDFTFEHGFSEFVPKSLADTSKLPIADRKHYLSISVTDPDNTVDIKTAEILDMNEMIIKQLLLKKADGDFYITEDTFVSPSTMFKIQVTGTVKKTGKSIRRISKTAIEPRIPPKPDSKVPVVTISEGTAVEVDYDGKILLTCKVSGYPAPVIFWTTADSNNVLSRMSNVVELPYEYISYLQLANIQHLGTYYCRASNDQASRYSKIDVKPRLPFKVEPLLARTSVKFGEEKKLMCGISSSHPYDITWHTPLSPSDYTLSADKKVLTIKQVSIAAQGRYACKATLKSQPWQQQIIATNVVISDLAPPSLSLGSPSTITTVYGDPIHIWCKIAGGIPRPIINWQFMMHNDNVFKDLPETSEHLIIDKASLANAGMYRCVAVNNVGETDQSTKVIVQRTPVIAIQEGLNKTITYGSSANLTCKATAFPLPNVGWIDSSGHEIVARRTIVNNEIISQVSLQNVKANSLYSCFAENSLGRNFGSIDILVTSPFVVQSHREDNLVSKYGVRADIPCGVKSSFPMNIRWFKSVGSAKSEIHTSDKYTISSTGNTLHILHTDLSTTGKYTCEAVLKDDINQKTDFTTEVQIDDLSPPVLQDTVSGKITVLNNDRVNIRCKIASGTPTPVVSWQVMRKGDRVFTNLSGSDQELVIESVTLNDAGQYRCIAKNSMGEVEKTTEVIVQRAPVIAIQEGSKITITYGSSAKLTCKTTAFPLPKVGWFDSSGRKIVSKNTIENNEITSQVNLQNVKENDIYSCFAENSLRRNVGRINVLVTSPFVVQSNREVKLVSKHGARTDIPCGVKSSFPMNIRWFKSVGSAKSEIHTSDKYTISSTGNTLHILHTDLNTTGKYTCEAVLKVDVNQKTDFTTEVQIDDLSPPVLQDTVSGKITVQNNDRVNIRCKIASGTPTPVVSWQVMRKGDRVFTDLSGSDQELVIESVTLNDAGQYRCIAKNAMGKVEKTTEVIVQRAPVIAIQEGSKITITYGSSAKLTCKTTAFPLPKVGWFDSSGRKIVSKNTIENNEITSQVNLQNVKENDIYSCFAENSLRRNVGRINILVTSPFVVQSNREVNLVSKYGARTDIPCGVKSSFLMNIRWFKSVGSAKSEIHTSDKYTISSTGNTLHILHTDLSTTGKYTCEAVLKDDINQKTDFTTQVQIDDLSPPVLQDTVSGKITVQNNDRVNIRCKIASGTPTPVVSWQVMRKGDRVFTDLSGSDQELVIESVTLNEAGQYRCIAKNTMGEVEKTTELIVQKAPESTIDQGATIVVPYGSTTELLCRVVAYPPPRIVWTNTKGHELTSEDTINNSVVTSRLKVQDIRAADSYLCYAENDLGKSVARIQVSILPPIDFAVNGPEITSVKYGDPTTIMCDVKSSFPIKIKWFYQKTGQPEKSEIHATDKFVISPDDRELRITSTDLDLVGKYTCEASLVSDESEKKSFTTEVEINNLNAPEITYNNDTITIMHGQKLVIGCKASGVPEPVTTWQVQPVNSNKYVTIPGQGDIVNTEISYEWAGLYKCTATNKLGKVSRTTKVIVYGKPKITNADSTYVGITGDRVLKIPCEVSGVPKPDISWKQGSKAATSDDKVTVSIDAIFIKNPTEKDSSNFTCEAKNIYGTATKNFEAVISDFITWNEDTNLFLKPGESADLKCTLTHSDPQSVRWYVNGEKVPALGTFYKIINANFGNDGNYTCRVNTDHGSDSLNYVVDVGYEPTFKLDPSSTVNWKGNKEESLDCDVNAKPGGDVKWTYNGKELNDNSAELPIFSWGIYSCNVSNVHGSVQRTFDVTSDGCVVNRTAVRVKHTPLLIGDKASSWPQFDKENEFLTINKNEIINLECSTEEQPANTFKTHPTDKIIHAKCLYEDNFIVNGETLKFEELQCKEAVRASPVFTKKSCMKTGELIEIGFQLSNGFLGVYSVCYSKVDDKTLFTKVDMLNVNLGNKVEPSFKLNDGIKTANKYPGEIMKCQYNQRWFVSPVDVAFGPAQTATLMFYKYNAVPVYEPCDGSSRISWTDVENVVQSALLTHNTLTAWTGASNYDSHGRPRYLWKVVKFEDDTFETIVYVNAPNPGSYDIKCAGNTPDSFSDIANAKDQYTYSCSLNNFTNAFGVPMSEFGITD